MQKQGFGRIIMTTSAAGIYGNAGQANYSAAKLALVGLANTLALEGKSKNIHTNTIAPVAGTRLTATVMPQDLIDALKTEYVAPLVAFLCHESTDVNGGLFEVGAGWMAKLRRERTKGKFFPLNRGLTPEDIRDNFAQITDFTNADVPEGIQDSLNLIMNHINSGNQEVAPPMPPPTLRFDGKVVVVTGAGGGLGRTYALMFASRGAKVVVNDLGGSIKGGDGGADTTPAQKVVDEIKAAGGEAVPNYDSVEFGSKIIQTAISTWGRVDIVICNAGILRDRSFAKLTDQDFDLVNKVHAKGSFSVAHAAWEHMRKQNFGRIIMTTSAAGLYGNYGQANYSAAKLGLLGLGNTLAIEGARRNIFVNTIAPVAGTRMTATVMPPSLLDSLKTEYIAPLVLYLCHESSTSNGEIFEVGAGWVSNVRWQRSRGHFFKPINNKPFALTEVRDSWNKVVDFTDPTHPKSTQDSIGLIISALEQAKQQSAGNEFVQPDKVVGFQFQPMAFSYTEKDVAFYALSIGAAANPLDDSELSFVYENHANFQAIPTFGIIFPFPVLEQLMSVEGITFNPMMLLHGEQYLEIKKPIPTSGTLVSTAKISGLYDKGKGVTVVIDATSKDKQTGEDVVFNQFTVFIRGVGGYNGDRGPTPLDLSPPKRKPDVVVTEKTTDNQALFYRLASGDLNPLHADPAMAAMGRFPKPILHGMCTYGFAGRAILKHYCNNDSSLFKSIQARLSMHVFPGETIQTELWKVADDKIIFQCKVLEREGVVISNAAVTLRTASNISSKL